MGRSSLADVLHKKQYRFFTTLRQAAEHPTQVVDYSVFHQ